MSGWDDTPATTEAPASNANNNRWAPAHQSDDAFGNPAYDVEHFQSHGSNADFDLDSKHNRTDGGGLTGRCFNCGETGHNKVDCQNPRIERPFDGNCRVCDQVGHRAADCPEKPALICRACGVEGNIIFHTRLCQPLTERGHVASACSGLRILYGDETPVLPPDEALENLRRIDNDGGATAFRDALKAYTRANPDMDFVAVEDKLRADGFKTYLIAKKDTLADITTLVDLQGNIDCAFVVTFQRTAKPTRQAFATGWPESAEENRERLKNAGIPSDRMVKHCLRCKEIGHVSKDCPQASSEPAQDLCLRCGQPGHILRNCTEPRKGRSTDQACRNCQQSGHKAADCTKPRSADNVECRNCGEVGHFGKDCPSREERPPMICHNCNQEGHKALECTNERVMICRNCETEGHLARDCPEPPNPANMTCRNCDKKGHVSRACPEPKDYTKMQCRNCNEFGHGQARCPNPPTDAMGGLVLDQTEPIVDNWEANIPGATVGSWEHANVSEIPVAATNGWNEGFSKATGVSW